MRTVLIAEPNDPLARALAAPLAAAGYRAVTCPGPWPPARRCIRCDVGYCPLTEGADLLIYSPDLIAYAPDGSAHVLAVDSARAHPDVPVLLAWSTESEPPSVGAILAQAPNAQRAAREADALVKQVQALIGPAFAPAVSYRPS